MVTTNQAAPGGVLTLPGKPVSRLGLGTLRLTGPGTWGPPTDAETATTVLREAVHTHGITHIDTADAYGPHTVEELIRRTLHPYPDRLLIATKVGLVRPGPNQWTPLGRPAYLRASVEASLRRLGRSRVALAWVDFGRLKIVPRGAADRSPRARCAREQRRWVMRSVRRGRRA